VGVDLMNDASQASGPSCMPARWLQYGSNRVAVAPVVFDEDVQLTVMHMSDGTIKRTAWSITDQCSPGLDELYCHPGSGLGIRTLQVSAGSHFFHVAGTLLPSYVIVEPVPPAATHTTCASARPISAPLGGFEDDRVVDTQSRWYTFQSPYAGLFVSVYTVWPWVPSVGTYHWRLFSTCTDTVPIAETTFGAGGDRALQASGNPPGTRFYLQLVTATPGLKPGFIVKQWGL
jgi:hypothetical protein